MTCGWQLDPRQQHRNVYKQQARTPEQNQKLNPLSPDYVLYAHDDSDRVSIVIEAKKPGISLSNALSDAINKYAKKINAPIAIASDGWRVKTWHIERNEPLFINDREVDELFSAEMTRRFITENRFSSFSQEVALSKDELLNKFKKANRILHNEGFSAGVERFSEFANLMFLKLLMEGGSDEVAGYTWSDIEAKQGTALLKMVKHMLQELRKEHGALLEASNIKNPKNMERLIEILSSFRLSSVAGDIKGMAFEHFIHSYTRGVKNDLGQFFTPRHIVKMMVQFLDPKIGETIYDPFCGTGGMLIECFRYVNQRLSKASDKKELRENMLFGRDHTSVARIAMMNMIMFGDGHSNIQRGDTFALLGETRGMYDAVITISRSRKKRTTTRAIRYCQQGKSMAIA